MNKSIAEGLSSEFIRTPTTVPVSPISAAPEDVGGDADPNAGLPGADQALAAQAVRVERALESLYQSADDGADPMMAQLAHSHDAFATRLAGIGGIASTAVDDDVVATYQSDFATNPRSAALAAENMAAALHSDWTAKASDARLVSAFASMAIAASRLAATIGFEVDVAAAITNDQFDAVSSSGGQSVSEDGSTTQPTETTEGQS